MSRFIIALGVCSLLAAAIRAEDDPKKLALLSAEEAGPDFAVQGEYSGRFDTDEGERKVGVQVIALGDGKFRAQAYVGGLPGDGWNGETCIQAEGETKDGETVFTGDNGPGVIKDGALTVYNGEGDELGRLEKVHRKSPTLGAKPPEHAVVLFPMKMDTSHVTVGEGKFLVPAQFEAGRVGKDGLLMPGAVSQERFQDCTLHMEFLLSFMPHARGQARSNSGVYLQGRYEVQILDSFGLEGRNNECGGIYEIADPAVNMCYPPLSWQTYDIEFTAARFDESGKKTADARMTVKHNGVVIHENVEVPRTTRGGRVGEESAKPGPIYIQDHGNPLRFRNVWIVVKETK
ncbi:MAG: 3-keto-disaccharide hydrolase [Planctomycetaceae bacterium]